jgi:tetratricopeptide (TPR) repeat protein
MEQIAMRHACRTLPLLVFCLSLSFGADELKSSGSVKEPDMQKLRTEARRLIGSKQPADAVVECDKIIAAFEAKFRSSKKHIFCARTSAETLSMLLKAAVDRKDAEVLSSTWADAYFLKGYAQVDLGKIAEAKATYLKALDLSPLNSEYLSELAQIYVVEKDWPNAKQFFEEALDNAELSPESTKSRELGRARRGIAYVLVEQGKLAEAAKIYEQCLDSDPNDATAKTELNWVRRQMAKKVQ